MTCGCLTLSYDSDRRQAPSANAVQPRFGGNCELPRRTLRSARVFARQYASEASSSASAPLDYSLMRHLAQIPSRMLKNAFSSRHQKNGIAIRAATINCEGLRIHLATPKFELIRLANEFFSSPLEALVGGLLTCRGLQHILMQAAMSWTNWYWRLLVSFQVLNAG